MKTLGIIGFGQFGQLTAKHLKPFFNITVADKNPIHPQKNYTVASIEEASSKEIVILAVPLQAMEETLKLIAPHLVQGALVMDVCSVKTPAIKLMKKHLPAHVDIIGTHPLFGPQSSKSGIAGLPFIICPVRGGKETCIKKFAEEKLNLKVHVITEEEHDKEMAYIQGLTHLIGQAMRNMKIPKEQLATNSYLHLLEMCSLVKYDTLELFQAIQNDNPYAKQVTHQFQQEIQDLLKKVDVS